MDAGALATGVLQINRILIMLCDCYLELMSGAQPKGVWGYRIPRHLGRKQICSRYLACRQICSTPLALVDAGT